MTLDKEQNMNEENANVANPASSQEVPSVETPKVEGKVAERLDVPKKFDDRVKSRNFKGKGKKKSSEEGESSDDTDGSFKAKDVPDFIEKVIAINRITKVTKGGKKLSFSALVVVGDSKGKVGYALEKAAEVSIAIKKSIATAKRNMITVPLRGSTITHEIIGECSGAQVLLKPASEGTGVIAAGPVRAVCDGAGIHNILSKCHRSNNPVNVVKATFNGLERLKPYIN